jgi:uncharacterized protein (DUF2132 family)
MTTPNGSRDPLHGVTLERMLTELVEKFGWPAMHQNVKVRCFEMNPSIKSSLVFLRKTPWAREKVEDMYRRMIRRRDEAARVKPSA